MRGTVVALVVGSMLTAAVSGLVLSSAPLTVAATNSVAAHELFDVESSMSGCQASGTIPRGTSAIRVSLDANIGPRVSIRVFVGSRLVTYGDRRPGWGVDETVTVPMRPLRHAVQDAKVCTTVGRPIEFLQINGTPLKVSGSSSKVLDSVALRMEYLRPGPRPWISRVGSIVRALGLAHAAQGTGLLVFLLALMAAVLLVAWRLTSKELQ